MRIGNGSKSSIRTQGTIWFDRMSKELGRKSQEERGQ